LPTSPTNSRPDASPIEMVKRPAGSMPRASPAANSSAMTMPVAIAMLRLKASIRIISGGRAPQPFGHSVRVIGFGHRVYKNYDPRAKIMQKTMYEVLEATGHGDDPLMQVALELEKIALNDPYFIDKKLYPNVDFYSGITLRALGFPTTMFTVLFALARTVGWIAQWNERIEDPQQRIGRPRQLYTGSPQRDYLPVPPSADRHAAPEDIKARPSRRAFPFAGPLLKSCADAYNATGIGPRPLRRTSLGVPEVSDASPRRGVSHASRSRTT